MKVLVNGGLNLSVLDGWWAEAYEPELGWALPGDGDDARAADRLYSLLEGEIRHAFYDRDASEVPRSWVQMVRRSMTVLTPRFSADRTVREYTAAHYVPLARAYRARAEHSGKLGSELERWRRRVHDGLPAIHVARLTRSSDETGTSVEIHLLLGDLEITDISVELHAEGLDGGPSAVVALERTGELVGSTNGHAYRALLPADRDPAHFVPRVVPSHPAASVPLESSAIRWLD